MQMEVKDAQLQDVIKELKKIKNELVVNNAVSFLSDVTALSNTITTESAANSAGAIITFTTPNVWIDMVKLSVGVDSNTATNYRWSLTIDGIAQLDNVNYKRFISQTFDYDDGIKIRLRPYTKISFNAYNYNGAVANGNAVLFFLGDMIKEADYYG